MMENRIALVCILGLLAGCTGQVLTEVEVHRDWSKKVTLFKDLSVLHGDSLTTTSDIAIVTTLAARDLASLADSSDDWTLDTAGIPFDSAFAPVLPTQSRIMARKAASFRLEFNGMVLGGEAHIVEYRYAATTYDVEYEYEGL